ncbi:MAG: hypothetical protein JW993_13765 [Sedimentisphaerales bacterium]|nr:hypothetical protein [Sedimentisphaerales bacterium]
MENEEAPRPGPVHIPIGKLALAAGTLAFGAGVVLLGSAGPVPSPGSAVLVLSGLIGATLVAPFLGLGAVLWVWVRRRDVFRDGPDDVSWGQRRTLGRRFLIGSFVFAAASLLVLVFLSIPQSRGCPLDVVPAVWHGVTSLAALAIAWIASRLFARLPGPRRCRLAAHGAAVLSVAVVALTATQTNVGRNVLQRLNGENRAPTFVGDSNSLEGTVIVPTLDTPRPDGVNVVWCSSFQLAWDAVRDTVIGAPVEVVGAEEVAARLNAGRASGAALEPGSYYAMAGRFKDGVIERIETDMATKFPKQRVPNFRPYATVPDGILAYAYLTAGVSFTRPFPQLRGGLAFTDGRGVKTTVGGFGLRSIHQSRHRNVREQVDVLYAGWPDPNHAIIDVMNFAVDLCKHSEPYQVVVAVVEPGPSLAATLERLERQITSFRQGANYEHERVFGDYDDLEVPETFWDITHRFEELIGQVVANAAPAMPIVEAMQQIRFRLDRSGAILESSSGLIALAMSRRFLCNRPFLIYMRKRGADQPFFVMWVDNAELLMPK